MAKAPTTAAEFDGSGQVWFKIDDIGPSWSGTEGTSDAVATWDLERAAILCHEISHTLTSNQNHTHTRFRQHCPMVNICFVSSNLPSTILIQQASLNSISLVLKFRSLAVDLELQARWLRFLASLTAPNLAIPSTSTPTSTTTLFPVLLSGQARMPPPECADVREYRKCIR